MNILLIGNGGREHALAYAIVKSPLCRQLFIASGNPGTAQLGQNLSLDPLDFSAVYEVIDKHNIGMVVIGPEQPLVEGLADFLHGLNVRVVGPGRDSAQLEGSKKFSKSFMKRYGIPTANFQNFHSWESAAAKSYARSLSLPVVIKASGLAGGKGVLICDSYEKAEEAIDGMLHTSWFGLAGDTIVVEEYLDGIEISVFILTDGKNYVLLPHAKDYKRVGEGDKGLNTGGMGAVSPVPFADETLMAKIEERIINRTFVGLEDEEMDYRGFIFFGIMVVNGDPYLLEYNCRMGDPESEVVIPRIESDLVELMIAACDNKLGGKTIAVSPKTYTTVMLVSGGYPEAYQIGKEITGLRTTADSLVFHAGTTEREGVILTNGGRVIACTGSGDSLEAALRASYALAESIEFEGKYYRKDIGFDLSR
jgi:phosphoribosylamine--glycine ligase